MSKRKRGFTGGGRNPASTNVPLSGALITEGDTPDSLALKMLIGQMQSFQQQNLLELQAMTAALQQQNEQVKALQLEIAAIKHDAAAALGETRVKLQQLMERRPTDPATLQKMVKEAQIQASRQMHEANLRFVKELAQAPRGDIDARDIPYTGEAVRLIINGVSQNIIPGKINTGIPQPFIDHWDKRKDEARWAAGLNAGFLAKDKDGDFYGAGHYNNLLGASNDEKPSPVVELTEVK